MLELLIVLASIALIDSASITPLGIVPLTFLLASRRPYVLAGGFLAGLFVSYLLMALAFLFGLQTFFGRLNVWLTDWLQNPQTMDMILQIVIGLVLLFFGVKIAAKRRQKVAEKEIADEVTVGQAFWFAFGLNVVGFPGAVPYFAAADQILRADLPAMTMALLVVYYVTVFLVPLSLLVVIRALLGERGDLVMTKVKEFFDRWGPRMLAVVLIGLGLLLAADGIGWLLGKPILPMG